ncbi:hypothetical protein [Syntrophomonas palmitatica]|uniref:hypothetical protein n=1 Tax=Syntrophomonas palmitatica TaxID=402877 RepID=UPI0006D259E2|nr:hypothetical protein [Syntrophomonas palmitatica]
MGLFRKWFIITLITILLLLTVAAGFNYYIDPLWNFAHANRYNRIQMGFDERQQKTNRVGRGNFNYNTIILGSSRTTYINQYDFAGYRAYNYAVSNMLLDEYYEYIEYAKAKNGREFDCIVLGLDFYATNRSLKFKEFQRPAFYINKNREFAYRYKTLLSWDTLQRSWRNYEASRRGVPVNFAYDRNNVKTLLTVSDPQEKQRKVQATVDKYHRDIYANYQYADVKTSLEKIKKANPHSRFIVFTTPVSRPLFNLMISEGLFPYYEQWLRDAVAVFGEVHHFMYPNSVTENLDNFYDASHIYPHVGTLVVRRITGAAGSYIPPDFGIKLTAGNIDSCLRSIERQCGPGLCNGKQIKDKAEAGL